MTSIYNQLMITWNNLDWQFRIHIPKPKKDIIMQDFFNALDSKASIWKEMARHNISSTGPAPRMCYISNLGFWAGASRSNQYPLRQSQSTRSDEVTLNKLLEAITSIAQRQPQSSPKQYLQWQPNNTSFYEQKQWQGRDILYQSSSQNQFQIKNSQSPTPLPAYRKRQPRFDQIQEAVKKSQKAHAFLHEEIGTNSQIEEEFNHKDANYYDSPELDYYEPDTFN